MVPLRLSISQFEDTQKKIVKWYWFLRIKEKRVRENREALRRATDRLTLSLLCRYTFLSMGTFRRGPRPVFYSLLAPHPSLVYTYAVFLHYRTSPEHLIPLYSRTLNMGLPSAVCLSHLMFDLSLAPLDPSSPPLSLDTSHRKFSDYNFMHSWLIPILCQHQAM